MRAEIQFIAIFVGVAAPVVIIPAVKRKLV